MHTKMLRLPPSQPITIIKWHRTKRTQKKIDTTVGDSFKYAGGVNDWDTEAGMLDVRAVLREPFEDYGAGTTVHLVRDKKGFPAGACAVVAQDD